MNRIKCATFDKDMQDSIPKEIREKMKADRAKAEKEQESKAKTLPINFYYELLWNMQQS